MHLGADFCSHIARSIWQLAEASRSCGSELLLDVISAFDTVVRGLVYRDDYFDDRVAKILHSMNLAPEVMHDLANFISEQPALDSAGVSAHVSAAVREPHSDTWHSTQGMPNVTATYVGSKPGDPLGDIIFNFLACRVLSTFERQASEQGLIT